MVVWLFVVGVVDLLVVVQCASFIVDFYDVVGDGKIVFVGCVV